MTRTIIILLVSLPLLFAVGCSREVAGGAAGLHASAGGGSGGRASS